jgi:hypothetical protein
MISFFEDVPADLEGGAYRRLLLQRLLAHRPALVKPGVVATAICLSCFPEQLPLLGDPGRLLTRTLPIADYTMISYEEINWAPWPRRLITLPVPLVPLRAHRHIRSGLTFGAVKQQGQRLRAAERTETIPRLASLTAFGGQTTLQSPVCLAQTLARRRRYASMVTELNH